MESRNSSIARELDSLPLGAFQICIITLCGLVVMIDGYHTQVIAFLAPAIAQGWGVHGAQFGPVFGAGLLGGMLGAMAFGAAADRFGRKPGLLISILIFGVASIATTLAHSMPELMAYRFVTGFGLGGAMPSAIALTAEYSPLRSRSTLITAMFCGFPLGAAIGGIITAPLVAATGWRSVFLLGGVIPLILLPFVLWLVPESLNFLLMAGRTSKANRIMSRLHLTARAEIVKQASAAETVRYSIRESLFGENRLPGTILLWVVGFLSLGLTFFLINWIPIVSRQAGVGVKGAVIGAALLNLGSIFGCALLGHFIDRFGPYRVIAAAYVIGTIAICAIGYSASATTLGLTAFIAGFFSLGAQMSCVALTATFYKHEFRATGVGWSMGFSRLGAIVAPVTGGMLVGIGLNAKQFFMFSAALSLLAAICIFLMGRIYVPSRRAVNSSVDVANVR